MDFLDAPVAADMQPGGKGRADHAVGRNSREPLKIPSLSPGSKDAARYGGQDAAATKSLSDLTGGGYSIASERLDRPTTLARLHRSPVGSRVCRHRVCANSSPKAALLPAQPDSSSSSPQTPFTPHLRCWQNPLPPLQLPKERPRAVQP